MQSKVLFDPFSGPTIAKVIPTIPAQTEIWIACKLGGDDANRAYNESVSLLLKGNLEHSALDFAVQTLLQRHETLRAAFSPDGNFMTILEYDHFTIDRQDYSQLTSDEAKMAIADYKLANSNFVFDLSKGPLLKFGLITASEQHYELIITAHHIVCDGWSMGVILEELGSLYSSQVTGKPVALKDPETFTSYVDEEQLFSRSMEYQEIENFWIHQFGSSIPTIELPIDFPRPPLRTYKGNRLDFPIGNDLVVKLKNVGVQSGASLVISLMSAFEVLLYHITGQDDLILGIPTAGQSASGKTHLVGHCVNLLPLRSMPSADISFQDYLVKRKNAMLDALEHQKFSYGQLLQKLSIARDPSRIPLAPIMFNIDMGMGSTLGFDGLEFELKSNPRSFETFEIFLNATGTEDALVLEWSYNTDLFRKETIEQMMSSFTMLLQSIVKEPHCPIGHLMTGNDDLLYQKLNNTQVSYPTLPLHELISTQAQKTPKNLAVEFNGKKISYEDLQKQANAVAHQLIHQGVRPGEFVGVSLPRSEKLPIILLAIMQCGAAYLPLDPSYPIKRIDYMLEDSKTNFLITSKSISAKIETNSTKILVEDLFSDIHNYSTDIKNAVVDNDALAYLLYTSGSTGKPKGVPITHKNLVNFLYSMSHEPGIEETDRLLSITTISFDIAGLELFLPLLKGATLVLTDDETTKDSRLLLEVLQNQNVTILQATPSTWQMLLDVGWQHPLPIKALSGGEALPLSLAKNILEKVDELWNMYGPTETTIWSAIKKIGPSDELITVGRPIANTQIHILNENMLPVKSGAIGEIAIGGDGVAKGYWKRPDLTKNKFLTDSIHKNIYLTGDLGKLLPTGEIQCLGRKDQQVKIRGHRIELEEIEEALNAIDQIQSAVVSAHKELLIAHVILDKNRDLSEYNFNDWKMELHNQLPSHMVPQRYYILEEFPTTLNGKIDRKKLSSFEYNNKRSLEDNIPATTNKSEELVIAVWQDCLKLKNIQPTDNFFELGGHSMVAVKVMAMLEKRTGKRLPLSALLEYPTVRQLASLLEKEHPSFRWKSLVPIKPNGTKTPLFIVHGANYNVLAFEKLAHSLDDDQPVFGLQAKGIDGTVEPDDSVELMAANFIEEIRTVYPNGPYSLAGFSFGGVIAYEMCKQLIGDGEKVSTLALFDSYVYPNYFVKNPFLKKTTYYLYFMFQLCFMGLNMFSNKKNFMRRIGLLKIKLSGLYLRIRYGKKRQMDLQFNRDSRIDKKHSAAFFAYNIAPQNIKAHLFRASENVYFAHDFKYLGWKNLATKGIEKHMVPGNHNDMFVPPNVQTFAQLLQDTLNGNE